MEALTLHNLWKSFDAEFGLIFGLAAEGEAGEKLMRN